MAGRPTLLTPDVSAKLCDATRIRYLRYEAAQHVDVRNNTVSNWLRWGVADNDPAVDHPLRLAGMIRKMMPPAERKRLGDMLEAGEGELVEPGGSAAKPTSLLRLASS